LIRLERVGRVFGRGPAATRALDGISLELPAGAFVALAGPSGSGKTSFLHLVGALDVPSSGRIEVGGRDLATLTEAERAAFRLHRVGFVFQEFSLVPVLSAAENVELPLLFRRDLRASERRRRVRDSLARVGLESCAGRRPAQLSGGEKQRVALARALAGKPALVLADEPTAHLDHESGTAVIQLMHEQNREHGTTFLYATHDPELVALAHRVIRLRDGRLTEPAA